MANRLRSEAGASKAPTPTADSPFKGKNPCNPMMAEEYIKEWIKNKPQNTHQYIGGAGVMIVINWKK